MNMSGGSITWIHPLLGVLCWVMRCTSITSMICMKQGRNATDVHIFFVYNLLIYGLKLKITSEIEFIYFEICL